MTEIYNRYFGNTGRVQRVPEPQERPAPSPPPRPAPPGAGPQTAGRQAPPRPQSGRGPGRPMPQPGLFLPGMQRQPAGAPEGGKPGGLLGSLAAKLDLSKLETEDLILLLILSLKYRESGDEELLIMMGAMFLL